MRPLKTDLSIYRNFNFTHPPVGIKYLTQKPEGIEQLDKNLGLCEMPKEAHLRGKSFYFTKENEACLGKSFLGMVESRPTTGTGQIGVDFEIFQDSRANRNIYPHQYLIGYGIVNYVVMAPLEEITFEPDLLFIMATVSQAEILLRAMSYSTGELWSTKLSGVGACTWLFVYPYLTGNVNYTVTGLSFGMKAKEIYPEGWIVISVPYKWIPVITENLKEMKWVLPSYSDGREKFLEREERVLKGML